MQNMKIFLLFVMVFALVGCDAKKSAMETQQGRAQAPQAAANPDKTAIMEASGQRNYVKMDESNANQMAVPTIERKIIRNGKLTIETDEPTQEQESSSA